MTRFADPAFFAAANAERFQLLHPAARVLEMGCGAGATGALALRQGLCAAWTGVDREAPSEALYALSEVAADISQVEGTFDVIFAPSEADPGALAGLLAAGGWLYLDGADKSALKTLRRAGLMALAISAGGVRGMKPR